MLVRMEITAGMVVDCTGAEALIDGIEAEYLLADRGYDANRVLAAARDDGMMPVILPKRSRKEPQSYDAVLYQASHLVENCFGKLGRVVKLLWPTARRRVSGKSPGTTPLSWHNASPHHALA